MENVNSSVVEKENEISKDRSTVSVVSKLSSNNARNKSMTDPNGRLFFETIYNSDFEGFRQFFKNRSFKPWEWTDDEGYSCLHRACFMNQSLLVNIIFEELKEMNSVVINTFVNKSSSNGSKAIHFASYRGNVDVINLLIQNGADITAVNDRGLDVLHMAAQGDQPGSLIYFKEKHGLSLESRDNLGNTALHWCCFMGSENFFAFLLSYNDNPGCLDINAQDNQGLAAIHLAVISEKSKIVKKLLHKGADRKIKDKKGRTPLTLAIEKNKIQIAEMLREDEGCLCNTNYIMRSNIEKTERSVTNMVVFVILHLIVENGVFFFILPHFKLFALSILFLSLFLFVMIFFVLLSCSNPGYEGYNLMDYRQTDSNFHPRKILLDLVKKNIIIDDYCPSCIVIKNQKKKVIKHCYYCERCIVGYDHHCYWVNNCIGDKNINLFFIFITFVVLNLLLQIFIALYGILSKDSLYVDDFTKIQSSSSFSNFPPTFSFFENLHFYDRKIKVILSSVLLVISICFLLPVLYLWYKNVKSLILRIKKKKKERMDASNKRLHETIIDEGEKIQLLEH